MKIRDITIRRRHRKDAGDVAALAESMRTVGLLHPVVVSRDGILIAGERRIEAAKQLGWDVIPSTVATDLDDALSLLRAERDENTQRKDFAPSEAVAVARDLAPLERKAAKARQAVAGPKQGKGAKPSASGKLPEPVGDTRDKLAAAVGLSGRNLEKATAVVEAAEEDPAFAPLVEQMDRTGVHRAYMQLRRERRAREAKRTMGWPDAKYRVLYADPPWNYADKADAGSVQGGGAEQHYPSMTMAQLCELPVEALCESDAVLFLWVTSPLLLESAPVITAWGFVYKASFVWDKVKHNVGHYNSVRHELLLVCTRGSCTPDVPQQFDSVQTIERGPHSEKPEDFRRIIDTLYPNGKRIEFFPRRRVAGWDAYGYEAEALVS